MRHKSLRLFLIFLLVVLLAPLTEAQLSSEYAGWADGPEGFLLTKKEKKEWNKVATDAEAKRFIELFWARRNPEVNNPFNSFKAEFDSKVKFADENFGYPGHRGSLSDRAKVLILMGRPGNRYRRGQHRGVAVQPRRTPQRIQGQGIAPPLHVLRGKARLQQLLA